MQHTLSMNTYLIRTALSVFALCVVGYPLTVWYSNVSLNFDATLFSTIFPAFGLAAFTTMYLNIIGRPFAAWLEQYIPFKTFGRLSSKVVLLFLILHPLFASLYLISTHILFSPPPGFLQPILLGVIGFSALILYDIGRAFHKNALVTRYWVVIDVVSTIGFYLLWVHSLALGSDLQTEPLRTLWIAYGITAAIASCYVLFFAKRPTEGSSCSSPDR